MHWSAPACPRRSTRRARLGVATNEPAARCTRQRRLCSRPSPRHHRGRRRSPSNPATYSAGSTPSTCAHRPTTSDACVDTSAHSWRRCSRTPSRSPPALGAPLDPPLLVVLDEAAHIAPLPELDGLAATCASHGIQLVTVWQVLAQVKRRYGGRAATVLNNHRAKLFLPGIADPDTLEYASRLVGDEEVTQPSVTRDARGWAFDHVLDGNAPAPTARRAALPPARAGGARLRDPPAGPTRAAAVVGSAMTFVAAAEPRASSKTAEGSAPELKVGSPRFPLSSVPVPSSVRDASLNLPRNRSPCAVGPFELQAAERAGDDPHDHGARGLAPVTGAVVIRRDESAVRRKMLDLTRATIHRETPVRAGVDVACGRRRSRGHTAPNESEAHRDSDDRRYHSSPSRHHLTLPCRWLWRGRSASIPKAVDPLDEKPRSDRRGLGTPPHRARYVASPRDHLQLHPKRPGSCRRVCQSGISHRSKAATAAAPRRC